MPNQEQDLGAAEFHAASADQTIADLRDKLTAAEAENAKLREELARIKDATGHVAREALSDFMRAEKAEAENLQRSLVVERVLGELTDLRNENANLRQELALARAANTSLSEIFTLAEGQEPETPLDAVRSLRDDRDSEARWAAQYLDERDKLQAENAKLKEELAARVEAMREHLGAVLRWAYDADRTGACDPTTLIDQIENLPPLGDPTPHLALVRAALELAEKNAALRTASARLVVAERGSDDGVKDARAEFKAATVEQAVALDDYLDAKKKAGL